MPDGSLPRPDLLDAVRSFAASRGRPALIYFVASDAIGTPTVREVAECIGDRHFDDLDIVIDSGGGDIHAAYLLVSFLRLHTKRLEACVPRYARSAATLLCLGADSIVLDELAALGPLDAQVYEGVSDDASQKYGSALNAFKALERLRDFSLDTLQGGAEFLNEVKLLRPDDALKHAMELVRVITAPLFDKIQAEKLGEFSQALAIGEEYGRRLLAKTAPMLSQQRRDEVLQQLVHQYPSHEYVIDYQELTDLGLEVALFEGEQRRCAWALANYARRLAEDEKTTWVTLVDPDGSWREATRQGDVSEEVSDVVRVDDATRVMEERDEGRAAPAASRHQAAQRVSGHVATKSASRATPWSRPRKGSGKTRRSK
jgi:hypothetical protein